MSDYERTLSVEAPADAIYGFVADPANLGKFLPDVEAVIPEGEQRVRIQGQLAGQPYDAEGFLKTDQATRTVEWSSGNQRAELLEIRVEPGDVAAALSEITLRLSNNQTPADTATDADEAALDWIGRALAAIRQHVEHEHRHRKANFL